MSTDIVGARYLRHRNLSDEDFNALPSYMRFGPRRLPLAEQEDEESAPIAVAEVEGPVSQALGEAAAPPPAPTTVQETAVALAVVAPPIQPEATQPHLLNANNALAAVSAPSEGRICSDKELDTARALVELHATVRVHIAAGARIEETPRVQEPQSSRDAAPGDETSATLVDASIAARNKKPRRLPNSSLKRKELEDESAPEPKRACTVTTRSQAKLAAQNSQENVAEPVPVASGSNHSLRGVAKAGPKVKRKTKAKAEKAKAKETVDVEAPVRSGPSSPLKDVQPEGSARPGIIKIPPRPKRR
ncbi:unnamed protein product [Peniophora sp. CBMAI 1063]|nr:unnamed protein product [Peniophora sp. CBMAI 1063]